MMLETRVQRDYELTTAQRVAVRARWKELQAAGMALDASHHLTYALVLGRDWRKGLTPPTNAIKVANGAREGWLFKVTSMLLLCQRFWEGGPFNDLLEPSRLRAIQGRLPEIPLLRAPTPVWTEAGWTVHAYRRDD